MNKQDFDNINETETLQKQLHVVFNGKSADIIFHATLSYVLGGVTAMLNCSMQTAKDQLCNYIQKMDVEIKSDNVVN